MAINTTTRQTTAFTSGNNFAFAFKVYEVGDVKVIRITTSTGAEEVLTITTHYTVTLNDDQNANPGGTVTLVSSGNPVNLGSGFSVVITSKVTPLQQTEITNQGGFFPEVINDVLDKAAILDQQQQSILDKTIRFPLTQTVGGLEITENAANRAGKVVQFDGSGDLAILGTVDGRDVSADGAKLDTIETNAKDDQTAAEIRALTESATDSNVFTDNDHSKLNGIEPGATGDQDASEIKSLYESNSNTNVFTDNQVTKLTNIEDNATADQNAAEIRSLVESATDSNVFTDNDHTKLNAIEDNATRDQTATEIKNLIATSPLDASHLAANSVDSSELVDGSVDHVHLSLDCVDGDNIQNDSIDNEHIAANAVRVNEIKDGEITSAKLNPNTVITASEQASATPNDTSFLTSAAADARFFNISSGDTIKDGDTFPDNDTTIATTAAINDRIIDLVDDVGGFVPIANETSFPTANPDAENGTGTIVSVKAASTNLTPSGTTVTIANGAGTGNTVTITGVPSVIPSGFGFLVETTTTLHTYTFHRLTPKATEVTTVATNATQVQTVHNNITNINAVASNASNINAVAADASDIGAVAGKATEIGRLGTADAVADLALLGTTDIVADMNMLATSDVIADMNMLATSDVIADMALLAVTDVISDMNDLATSANITAMSTCSTNISSITNASNNISSVNNFGDKYQIASNDPSTDGGGNALAVGDLYFNTSANELKIYNGSSWQGGVTATGNFASTTGNTFTGDNLYNDQVILKLGTGSDLQLKHTGVYSLIQNHTGELKIAANQLRLVNKDTDETYITADDNGKVELYYDNLKKFETQPDGCHVFGTGGLQIYGEGNSNALLDLFPTGSAVYSTIRLNNAAGSTSCSLSTLNGGTLYISSASGGNIVYRGTGTGDHVFETNSVERMRIDDGVIKLPDDQQIQFGASADLAVYYNSTSDRSILQSNGARLDLRSDSVHITSYDVGETMATFTDNGAVELYFDNYIKIATTADGIHVTGGITGTGHIDFLDDSRIKLGTSDDLIIYHAVGGNSYIQHNSSGTDFVIETISPGDDLFLRSADDVTISVNATVDAIKCIGAAQVELYYNGTKTFENRNNHHIMTGNASESNLIFKASNGTDIAAYGHTNSGQMSLYGQPSGGGGYHKYFEGNYNSSSKLYFDNLERLVTQSAGVNVNGNLNAYGSGNGNINVIPGSGHVYADIRFYNNAMNAYGSILMHAGSTMFINSPSDILSVVNGTQICRATSAGYRPDVDSTFDLGTNAIRWRNAYVDTYYGDGSNLTGITTNLVGDTSPQLGGALDTNGNNITFADNVRIVMGDAGTSDSHIRWDGSVLHLAAFGSGIRMSCNGLQVNNYAGTETFLKAVDNGGVELYYNGAKTLETTVNALHLFGNTAECNIDLKLSNGHRCGFLGFTNSGRVQINGAAGGNAYETYLEGNLSAATKIFYDHAPKYETASLGGVLTGGNPYTELLVQTSTGVHQGRLQGWASGNDREIGIAEPASQQWFVRYDKNTSTGARMEYHWQDIRPAANNNYDLGSTSYRWRNIYTNDLNLSNEGGSNDVDGTWGSYTIQEGAEDLFLINKRSGKKYKFALTEVS